MAMASLSTLNGFATTARLAAAAAAVFAVTASCSSVPKVDALIDQPQSGHPEMVGARGPLTARQSNAVLERLQRETKGSDVLQRHLALETALAGSPLAVGNKATLLQDGPATFAAMFQAIHDAKTYVDLEYFTVKDIESNGEHLGDLLTEKRNQGVAVYLIYDSVGSIDAPKEFFDRLKQAGINLVEFNPVNPLNATSGYSLNNRDHRKILVADGAVGIIGGVNLDTVYSSNPLSSGTRRAGSPDEDPWRDNDLEIAGPAVTELQKLFIATWVKQGGKPIEGQSAPHVEPQGKEIIRIIGSTPDQAIPEYYVTLLSAISNAERRVWITAAYFVPTHEELEELENAALRGVDVRLLLPSHSDSDLALRVGHSHYTDLLENGVAIYEPRNQILHSKLVVIDGVWSVIGSSNFDHRSVLFNNEVDAVVLGRDTPVQMEAMLKDDFAKADPIELSVWKERPFSERIQDMFARLWQTLL
jgi:cardiolipin synthase A/B